MATVEEHIALAKQSKLDEKTIRRLVQDQSWRARESLARREDLSEDIVWRLSGPKIDGGREAEVRRSILDI